MMEPTVDLTFLNADSVTVAQQLIGWRLYRVEDGELIGGMIVETEAYSQHDAASHSYRGKTPRTEVMFGPSGHVYVYFTYGMHHCMNIVTGPVGEGSAVLIRAIRPDKGIDTLRARRKQRPDAELTNGPAKVCQALNVTLRENGEALNADTFLLLAPNQQIGEIKSTRRIGISKDVHRLWRFILADSSIRTT